MVLLVIGIFLLMPMNNVVRAEVVSETKILYIDHAQDVGYSSSMNILNNTTNNRFSNAELLIPDFSSKVGFDGGFSGSFLPPSKFQANFGTTSTNNNHLILANTIEFQQKNLLSGASESWWRCPYMWNYSISTSRDWDLLMSIYIVDDPRNANLTFPTANSNIGAIPNEECFPSLVFQKQFSDVGTTSNDNQTWTHHEVLIPKDDEWNISKPNLLSDNERYWLENTTEERRVRDSVGENATSDIWKGDFENYNKVHYSFGWFNVSAPIYPNETYFIIWDIVDVALGINDACSMWVTASDIGRNSHYRTLFAWDNSGSSYNNTIYEIPIDLDMSVIFRIGMGDGVTGIRLENNVADVQDHTTDILTDHSFEDGTATETDYAWDMSSSSGWAYGVNNGDSGDGWAVTGNGRSYLFWNISTITDSGIIGQPNVDEYAFLQRSHPIHFGDGMALKTKISFGDLYVGDGGSSYESQAGFEIFRNTAYGIQIQDASSSSVISNYYIWICRIAYVNLVGDVVYANEINYGTSSTTYNRILIDGDVIPKDCYISVTFDNNIFPFLTGDFNIRIYDQNNSFNPTYSTSLSTPYLSAPASSLVRFMGSIRYGNFTWNRQGALPDWIWTPEGAVVIDKVSYCQKEINPAWSSASPSGIDEYCSYPFDSFEVSNPAYRETSPINRNILQVDDYSGVTSAHSYVITQEVAYSISGLRNYYASSYYQLRENDTAQSIIGFDYQMRFGVSNNGGSTWSYVYGDGKIVDSSWHQVSTNFVTMNNANRFKIDLKIDFPSVSSSVFPNGDWKMGFIDNITIGSIQYETNYMTYEFYQEIDKTEFNSTNYYTLMLPFRHTVEPEFCPLVYIRWLNSAGNIVGSQVSSTVQDWYDDFLIMSIETSTIPTLAVASRIQLVNFGEESYLFLQDRNSDGYTNNRTEYKWNHIRRLYLNSPTVTYEELFFSPYYSFKTTEGQWSNADGRFNTEYFYYVVVRFVQFNDADPEILEVKFYDVEVEDFTAFRIEMSGFGRIYEDTEWLAYLEVRNRADDTFIDMIVDAMAQFWTWLVFYSGLGQFLDNTIGKFISTVLDFLIPAIEWAVNMFVQVFVIMMALAIFFITVFMFWKLVVFFILLSEGRVEEAIEQLNVTTSGIINVVSLRKFG